MSEVVGNTSPHHSRRSSELGRHQRQLGRDQVQLGAGGERAEEVEGREVELER